MAVDRDDEPTLGRYAASILALLSLYPVLLFSPMLTIAYAAALINWIFGP